MKKKLFMSLFILMAGVVLSGCTLGNSDEDTTKDDEITNVTVIDDINEDELDVVEEDVVDSEIADDEEIERTVIEDDVEIEDQDSVIPPEFNGTVAENSRVSGYEYEVAEGKLLFKWKVRSDVEGVYPKFSLSKTASGTIIATFPSLTSDAVAKEDSQFELGGQLPEMHWYPDGAGSKYEFLFEGEHKYEFKGEMDEDDNMWVILEIEL